LVKIKVHFTSKWLPASTRATPGYAMFSTKGDFFLVEEEEEIIRLPCLVGRVVGPLLAARALPLRCAASTMPSSALLAI
jgi:hypothetical protein